MSDDALSTAQPPAKAAPPGLHGLDPGELFARGLNTVQPSGGANAWEPPAVAEVGRLLPQYRIEKLIGRGGMGAVYKAVQINLDRPVAIKLLPAEIAADTQFVTRFEREARTLAKLQHSRIVTIHDSGQTSEGHLYFVMEYVDGTDLRSILKGPGLDPEQALLVVGQICDALQAAHRQGIVHRDIKPENVLISRDGYVKLADFGLARPAQDAGAAALTKTNVVMGTTDYMSPEQRLGETRADHRSDIFALGVMLYEMLTGQRPCGVFDPPSRKVQMDVRIDEVVLKALQSEPERRYQQVTEMRTDVERIRTTPLPAPAPAKPPRPAVPAQRPGKALLSAGAFCVLLLGCSGYFIWLKSGRSSTGGEPPATARPPAVAGDAVPTPPPSSPVLTTAPAPAANLIAATKDAPHVNSLGMKFVPVPITGGPTDGQRVLFSVWDTRVQDYGVFAQETKRAWPEARFYQGPTHPAVNVSWEDAQAFCQWLTRREQAAGRLPAGLRCRLPSDHEWSCATGIGWREDAGAPPSSKGGQIGQGFPWGTAWPPPKGAGNYDPHYQADVYINTSPVGSFAPNANGLYDMGGNVWQWCEDWYDAKRDLRVARGVSWGEYGIAALRPAYRGSDHPASRNDDFGFRCVIAPVSTPPAAAAPAPVVSAPVNAPTPPPSTPPPYTVAEKESLENSLLAHKWIWQSVEPGSYSWREVVFRKDGTMNTSTPANVRWSVIGPRSVALQLGADDRLILTFRFSRENFICHRDDGKEVVNGWVNWAPLVPAPASASPSTPGDSEPANLRDALSSYSWTMNDTAVNAHANVDFKDDAFIYLENGKTSGNRWSLIDPRTVDVVLRNGYRSTLTFDPSFKSYTNFHQLSGTRLENRQAQDALPPAPTAQDPVVGTWKWDDTKAEFTLRSDGTSVAAAGGSAGGPARNQKPRLESTRGQLGGLPRHALFDQRWNETRRPEPNGSGVNRHANRFAGGYLDNERGHRYPIFARGERVSHLRRQPLASGVVQWRISDALPRRRALGARGAAR